MNKEDLKLFEARIESLDEVIHILGATANCMYSPDDKEWDMLLTTRDRFSKHVDKLRNKLEELKVRGRF